jgi:hypothetical protein
MEENLYDEGDFFGPNDKPHLNSPDDNEDTLLDLEVLQLDSFDSDTSTLSSVESLSSSIQTEKSLGHFIAQMRKKSSSVYIGTFQNIMFPSSLQENENSLYF